MLLQSPNGTQHVGHIVLRQVLTWLPTTGLLLSRLPLWLLHWALPQSLLPALLRLDSAVDPLSCSQLSCSAYPLLPVSKHRKERPRLQGLWCPERLAHTEVSVRLEN